MFNFLHDNQAVKMEKDEDLNDHYSHTGIANSKLVRQNFAESRFLSEPNKSFQPSAYGP